MHKTILLALACTFSLAACSQNTGPTTQAQASPLASKMEDPGDSPVADVSSTDLKTLSLTQASPLTSPGWVRYTFSDGHALLYRNLDGMAAYGDVGIARSAEMPEYIRGMEERLAQAKSPPSGPQGTLAGQSLGLNPGGCSERGWWCGWSTKEYLWPNKTVYYRIPMAPTDFLGLFPDERDKVVRQINNWNATNTVVKWLPAAAGQDAVTFRGVSNSDYCGQASIGYQTRKKGPNNNYIALNRNPAYTCFEENNGIVTHEMGHVVGLFHEHERCDRDNFVTIATAFANTPKQCGEDSLTSGKFDYNSAMLYGSPDVNYKPGVPFGTYDGVYNFYGNNIIIRNPYLSNNDIKTINGIYTSPYNPY